MPSASHPRSSVIPPGSGSRASHGRSKLTARSGWLGYYDRLAELLAAPVSGTGLAVFRMALGILMALEAYALFVPHDAAISSGTPLDHYYAGTDLSFHFPYEGLEWLPLFPRPVMYALAGLLVVSGITMALGLFTRLSSIAVFAIWGYFWAVESTRSYWQSHYYLELLCCCLMAGAPSGRRYSIDAWRGVFGDSRLTIPFWPYFVLRGQLVIAYFYAGVAKLHYDWMVDGVPVRWFLADPNILKPYEWFLTPGQQAAITQFLHSKWLALALCHIGTYFDLAVGFLLLFRRTRIFGLTLMIIFHSSNWFFLFDDIGYFPIVGILTSLIFLDTDWPERLWRWLKHPRISAPDWRWAIIGGIVFPVVGLTLGWSLPATVPVDSKEAKRPHTISGYVTPLILIWLIWQSILPTRHFFIPGDARFTYEGFSFSWRLKADTRHGYGHQLFIIDPKIVAPDPPARSRIDWSQWRGERVIYRQVVPTQVYWPGMPEYSVTIEPFLGERVVYNPYSGMHESYPDDVAVERARAQWRAMHGRDPELIEPLTLSAGTQAIVEACTAAGLATEQCAKLTDLIPAAQRFERHEGTPEEATQVIQQIQGLVVKMMADESTAPTVRPIVRKIIPWGLYGEEKRPGKFFLVVDPQVIEERPDGTTQIRRTEWKLTPTTRQPGLGLDNYVNGEPMIVYMGELGAEIKNLLPLYYLADALGDRQTPLNIRWNSLQDMTLSKYMHASCQAFYLRRYARRVASLWEEQYGRRPAVHALTSVSYNGRPHQLLVDPEADLASVPVRWFWHNDWVKDLETERIPAESLENAPTGYRLIRR